MCRSIRTLHNFSPPASEEEIAAAALQYVRKLSGFARPSKLNETAFARAVEAVTSASRELLASLVTNAPARDREREAARARARRLARQGATGGGARGSLASVRCCTWTAAVTAGSRWCRRRGRR